MARNLNYDIPDNDTDVCYDNDPNNCAVYGRLYDWETAMVACLSGWHLPSDTEWEALARAVDAEKAGTELKFVSGWNSGGIVGTDNFGFSALPGGKGDFNFRGSGSFIGVGDYGGWWTSTEDNSGVDSYIFYMDYSSTHVSIRSYSYIRMDLYSVRCLQN